MSIATIESTVQATIDIEEPPNVTQSLPPAVDRVTRLLCGRMYLFGMVTSLPMILRLTGWPLRARAVNIGVRESEVAFHAWQSLLFSLVWSLPCYAAYLLFPATSATAAGWLYAFVALKVAVLNPLIARRYFSSHVRSRSLHLPYLSTMAAALSQYHMDQATEPNVSYFRRWRPFVGFGEELTAWTIVVDTSVPVKNPLLPIQAEPRCPSVKQLYDAIRDRCNSLGCSSSTISYMHFVEGNNAHCEDKSSRYSSPPARLEHTDASSNAFQLLVGRPANSDVVVTQSIRFSAEGRLLFCEFASLLIPPPSRGLSLQDRLFRLRLPLILLFGGAILWAGTLAATIIAPVTETLLWMTPELYVHHLSSLTVDYWSNFISTQRNGYWGSYRLIGASLLWVLVLTSARFASELWIRLGVLLGLKQNYGASRSVREFWGRGTILGYFELQDTIRLLKSQEKVITGAVCECLEACGVDATDFREKVNTFINQGVINSGQVRGNVIARVANIALKRGGRAPRARRTPGNVAA